MVIKSPFQDYYDFVGNRYGGGDPRIVYERVRLSPPSARGGQIYETHKKVEVSEFSLPSPADFYRTWDYGWKYQLAGLYLGIAGKLYLIARPANSIEPVNPNTFRLQPLEPPEFVQKNRWRWNWMRKHWPAFGSEFPCLIELSRLLKAPVFAIADVRRPWGPSRVTVTICGQCPILGAIGVPALIPPAQMYQDLAYFVGNTMKPVPDTQPPVEVSNREKILKAGFDLKQSFRHRV